MPEYIFSDYKEGKRHIFDVHFSGSNVAYSVVIIMDDYIAIDEVYVSPKHRGNKLARQLMDRIITEYGNQEVYLVVGAYMKDDAIPIGLTDFQLIKFYESLGFVLNGERSMTRASL